jgi:hypothetical protein
MYSIFLTVSEFFLMIIMWLITLLNYVKNHLNDNLIYNFILFFEQFYLNFRIEKCWYFALNLPLNHVLNPNTKFKDLSLMNKK